MSTSLPCHACQSEHWEQSKGFSIASNSHSKYILYVFAKVYIHCILSAVGLWLSLPGFVVKYLQTIEGCLLEICKREFCNELKYYSKYYKVELSTKNATSIEIYSTKRDIFQHQQTLESYVELLVDCKTVGFFLNISKEIGKAWRKSFTCVSLSSLALCFHPDSRPFVWLLVRIWIRKKTDCFAV